MSREGKLEMRGDPGVERGGCLVETEHGMLDARIVSQLDTIREHLGRDGGEKTKG
jgi:flagellar biosynthesis/type III secretory pathway protein FliH